MKSPSPRPPPPNRRMVQELQRNPLHPLDCGLGQPGPRHQDPELMSLEGEGKARWLEEQRIWVLVIISELLHQAGLDAETPASTEAVSKAAS